MGFGVRVDGHWGSKKSFCGFLIRVTIIKGWYRRPWLVTRVASEVLWGWLSKLWSLLGSLLSLIIIRHLIFRVPQKGP